MTSKFICMCVCVFIFIYIVWLKHSLFVVYTCHLSLFAEFAFSRNRQTHVYRRSLSRSLFLWLERWTHFKGNLVACLPRNVWHNITRRLHGVMWAMAKNLEYFVGWVMWWVFRDHRMPPHTWAKSHDHEIVTAPQKVSQGRPNTLLESCSMVTGPQVHCEVICDRGFNQMLLQWISILAGSSHMIKI